MFTLCGAMFFGGTYISSLLSAYPHSLYVSYTSHFTTANYIVAEITITGKYAMRQTLICNRVGGGVTLVLLMYIVSSLSLSSVPTSSVHFNFSALAGVRGTTQRRTGVHSLQGSTGVLNSLYRLFILHHIIRFFLCINDLLPSLVKLTCSMYNVRYAALHLSLSIAGQCWVSHHGRFKLNQSCVSVCSFFAYVLQVIE
jgi:hypothetical protein